MSMQHRAFLFDYEQFDRTLRKELEAALASGSTDQLLRFIEREQGAIKDPYEGEPLPATWRDLFDIDDVQQIGDVALTKFYNPDDDRGLGSNWDIVASNLEQISAELGFSPALGRTVGPPGEPFDPGKMGSYFLSPADVQRATGAVSALPSTEHIAELTQLLNAATSRGVGLYVTF